MSDKSWFLTILHFFGYSHHSLCYFANYKVAYCRLTVCAQFQKVWKIKTYHHLTNWISDKFIYLQSYKLFWPHLTFKCWWSPFVGDFHLTLFCVSCLAKSGYNFLRQEFGILDIPWNISCLEFSTYGYMYSTLLFIRLQ